MNSNVATNDVDSTLHSCRFVVTETSVSSRYEAIDVSDATARRAGF